MLEEQRGRTHGSSALALAGFFGVLLARTTDSINRIPADPGYQYIQEAAQQGFRSVFFGDPYFHLVTRLMAWVTTWFPLGWHAITLSLMAHALWAGCALAISVTVERETSSNWTGAISGFLLVSAPHASESIVGSIGSIKWPLLTAAIVTCSSIRTLRVAPLFTGAVLIATGLTQPLTFVCAVPLLFVARRNVDIRRTALRLCALISVTLLVQLLKVGLDNASSGRASKISEPWEGMGLFWWSGLLAPAIVCAAVILIALLQKKLRAQVDTFALQLGMLAVATSALSYLMGGIADRYFVAPLTLSLVAVVIQLGGLNLHNILGRITLFAVAAVTVLVPTVKWFSASRYLVGGPTWSNEVTRAEAECGETDKQQVALTITAASTVELDCEYILRG